MFCCKKTQHCYFLFLFSHIWEETEGDQSDDDDKTDESMPPDESDADEWWWVIDLQCTILLYFIKFRQISSKINIFVTKASFRHFVSFSSKRNALEPNHHWSGLERYFTLRSVFAPIRITPRESVCIRVKTLKDAYSWAYVSNRNVHHPL